MSSTLTFVGSQQQSSQQLRLCLRERAQTVGTFGVLHILCKKLNRKITGIKAIELLYKNKFTAEKSS